MVDVEFALTLILVGMGTTFVTLALLALLCSLLKKLFPYQDTPESANK